jgi:HPt (histidine-containing phosphotransfer) domain-containing protein
VSGVGGDAALYDQLLAHFRASYEPLLARLVSDRSTERRDAILRTAHMLRGTAPMLGAASLAELAARVEDGLKGGGEPDGEAIAALRAGLSATLAEAATQGDGRARQAGTRYARPPPGVTEARRYGEIRFRGNAKEAGRFERA